MRNLVLAILAIATTSAIVAGEGALFAAAIA